jgi:iron(III) transport system substrate-binding protein
MVPGAGADTTVTAAAGTLSVYSGRSEALVAPLIQRFTEETGIQVNVHYGDTEELASTILEEGETNTADVFFGQDAAGLGALALEDQFTQLPDHILSQVDERFQSPVWVGTSGRARVVAYNTRAVTETDLPPTIFGFTDPKWKGRIGWAPTDASFQAFVTTLRLLEGEDRAREWLQGIKANQAKVYENNDAILQALGTGEIDVGFVDHNHLFRFLREQGENFPVRNYYFKTGGPDALVNVAGVGILQTSRNQKAAQQFVEFLLGKEAQQYFADQTYEYPLAHSVAANPALPPLSNIETPALDLSDLEDFGGTIQLLQDLGIS